MVVQLTIVTFYLGITIAIGVLAKRKSTSASAYHGEKLGLFVSVAAATGEWLGGTSTIGIAEYGYSFGISGAWYTLANGIGLLVLGLFFSKLYRSLDTITVPGIIGKFIGVNARVASSVLLTFIMIAVGTAQIIAAGSFGVLLLKLDFIPCVLILGTGFIIYTLAGGMLAVGYTSILHFFVKYAGMILALLCVVWGIGGMKNLNAQLPGEYYNWMNIGVPRVSSWVIASILGTCTAQAGIQPILAARDVHTAKSSSIIGAIVVAPFGILTALLGMAAKVKFPELANAKLALPMLMMSLNPVIGGIVLSAILAAILSTVSPIILACGTMISKDIYQRKIKPEASDSELLRISRICTGLAGVLCIALAIGLYGGARILDIVYFAYSIRGALFIVLLLGIYWRKVSDSGAVASMLATAVTGWGWLAYKSIYGQFPIHPAFTETYAAVAAALVTTIIFSLLLPKDRLKN